MTRKTVLNPLNHPQMDPKWCQNVTQDGSFHGTQDGVCGYLSDGVNIQKTVQGAQDDQ